MSPAGKMKKPKGDAAIEKFIIGELQTAELSTLKKVTKEANTLFGIKIKSLNIL